MRPGVARKALDFVLMGLIDYIGSNKDLQQELGLGVERRKKNLLQEESNRESKPIERVFRILNDELHFVSRFLHYKILMYVSFDWPLILESTSIIICLFAPFIIHKNYTNFHGEPSECHSFDLQTQAGLSFICYFLQITTIAACKDLETPLRISYFVQNTVRRKVSIWSAPLAYAVSHARCIRYPLFMQTLLLIIAQFGAYIRKLINAVSIFSTKVWKFILECLPKKINLFIISRTVITTDVKEVLLRSLRESRGRLTNGESSLRSHGLIEHLKWACHPNGSTTEAILVWHIATTLLNHQKPPPQEGGDPLKKERGVASTLSNYCHYLVATLPNLLPDNVEWTEKKYRDFRDEILGVDGCSLRQLPISIHCDRVLWAVWGENSIAGKGARLAKELMKHAEDQVPVWTMLADFWAEMMLFIAPSENIDGHEEVLHTREFITQIWALLTHAGILTRPKTSGNGDNNV